MRAIGDAFVVSRETRGREHRKLYLIAFEGFRTEKQYFMGVIDNRKIPGIRNDAMLATLQRTVPYAGWSDPDKLLSLVDAFCESMKRQSYNGQLLVECALEELIGHCKPDQEEIHIAMKRMNDIVSERTDEEGFVTDVDSTVSDLEAVLEKLSGEHVRINLPEIPEWRGNENICIIIDRDMESHSKDKMEKFVTYCNRKGYHPYITNPCFEFWLLMHFDECINLDRSLIRINPKGEDGRRFTERELDRILRNTGSGEGYNKSELDPERFIHRIRNEAMRNCKFYCHDIKKINNEIGSTLCGLFDEILE